MRLFDPSADSRISQLVHLTHPAFYFLSFVVNLSPLFLSLQPHRILQALKRYMRAENKDRQHTIRHYQHVLAVDPEKAAQMKSQVSAAPAASFYC